MVKGVADLHRQLQQVPKRIQQEVAEEMERMAAELVREMNAVKPLSEIKLGWTWGDLPSGSMTVGKVKGNTYGKMSIRVYATASSEEYPNGFPAIASWFEFGTKSRRTKTGKSTGAITAQPYFFPVYRSNRRRIRSGLSRAVTRAVKQSKG